MYIIPYMYRFYEKPEPDTPPASLLAKEHVIEELPRKPAIENKVLHCLAKEDDGGKNDSQPEAEKKMFEHGRSVYERLPSEWKFAWLRPPPAKRK